MIRDFIDTFEPITQSFQSWIPFGHVSIFVGGQDIAEREGNFDIVAIADGEDFSKMRYTHIGALSWFSAMPMLKCTSRWSAAGAGSADTDSIADVNRLGNAGVAGSEG